MYSGTIPKGRRAYNQLVLLHGKKGTPDASTAGEQTLPQSSAGKVCRMLNAGWFWIIVSVPAALVVAGICSKSGLFWRHLPEAVLVSVAAWEAMGVLTRVSLNLLREGLELLLSHYNGRFNTLDLFIDRLHRRKLVAISNDLELLVAIAVLIKAIAGGWQAVFYLSGWLPALGLACAVRYPVTLVQSLVKIFLRPAVSRRKPG